MWKQDKKWGRDQKTQKISTVQYIVQRWTMGDTASVGRLKN